MRAIANWEEVPLFDSEEAEVDFWSEHKPDLRLMETALAGSEHPEIDWSRSRGIPGRARSQGQRVMLSGVH